VPPILLLIDRRHDERDRRAVGREVRVGQLLEREIVLRGHAARLRERRSRRQEKHRDDDSQRMSHARARFLVGAEAIGATGAAAFFLPELIESRLLRSASIRLTTLGGASTSGATISRPSIFASMISRRPTWYSSLYDVKSTSPAKVAITCWASLTSSLLTCAGMSASSSIASMLRISLAWRRVYMISPFSRGWTLIRYSRP